MHQRLLAVVRGILAWTVDDHSWVFYAEGEVEKQFGYEPRERVRILTAATVEALMRTELIEVGLPQGRDFLVDPAPPEAIARRLYDEWDANPYAAQAVIWMNATPLGHSVYEGTAPEALLEDAATLAERIARDRGEDPESAPSLPQADDEGLPNVRYLEDGPEHADAYHERLRGGGVDVTPAGFDPEGSITRLEDASFIIWRRHSADGTPALEFDIPSRGKVKLRFRG